jgi:EAL domain-containing protein (putative c-di-GMP-specific phosphodiesterase class I)
VLAEGVERYEEYRWLRGQGCRLFQGFWFAQPLDPQAFVAFAADPRALAERLIKP